MYRLSRVSTHIHTHVHLLKIYYVLIRKGLNIKDQLELRMKWVGAGAKPVLPNQCVWSRIKWCWTILWRLARKQQRVHVAPHKRTISHIGKSTSILMSHAHPCATNCCYFVLPLLILYSIALFWTTHTCDTRTNSIIIIIISVMIIVTTICTFPLCCHLKWNLIYLQNEWMRKQPLIKVQILYSM